MDVTSPKTWVWIGWVGTWFVDLQTSSRDYPCGGEGGGGRRVGVGWKEEKEGGRGVGEEGEERRAGVGWKERRRVAGGWVKGPECGRHAVGP